MVGFSSRCFWSATVISTTINSDSDVKKAIIGKLWIKTKCDTNFIVCFNYVYFISL